MSSYHDYDQICSILQSWNCHPLRTEGNLTPNQLWMIGMLQAPVSEPDLEEVCLRSYETNLRKGSDGGSKTSMKTQHLNINRAWRLFVISDLIYGCRRWSFYFPVIWCLMYWWLLLFIPDPASWGATLSGTAKWKHWAWSYRTRHPMPPVSWKTCCTTAPSEPHHRVLILWSGHLLACS